MKPAAERRPSTLWRRMFRWCRIWALFLSFILVFIAVYLNQFGLPQFVGTALTREMESRGIRFTFEKLRLGMAGSVIAEHGYARSLREGNSPRVGFDRFELKLDPLLLAQGRVSLDGATLRKGKMDWPVSPPGEPPRVLSLSNVVASLRMLPGEVWEIDRLEAYALGLKFHITASLTNVLARFQAAEGQPKTTNTLAALRWLDKIQALAETAQFEAPPEIKIVIEGDLAKPHSISGRASLASKSGVFQDLNWQDLSLSAAWRPWNTTNHSSPAHTVEIRARKVESSLGMLEQPRLALSALIGSEPGRLDQVDWNFEASRAQVGTAIVSQLNLSGDSSLLGRDPWRWRSRAHLRALEAVREDTLLRRMTALLELDHGIAKLEPIAGRTVVAVHESSSPLGSLRQARLEVKGKGSLTNFNGDPALSFWNKLLPWNLQAQLDWQGIENSKTQLNQGQASFEWSENGLRATNIVVSLYGGQVEASLELTPENRRLTARARSDFDLHRIAPLLTENSRRWLSQFAWKQPPQVSGQMSVILPSWTNAQPDWRSEVLPTLTLEAKASGTESAFRGISVQKGFAEIGLSNAQWNIPVIRVERNDGSATLAYTGHMLTKDYHWKVDSGLNPSLAAPLLGPGQERVFEMLQLQGPVRVQGDVWGRWLDTSKSAVDLSVSASNFVFRGVSFDEAATKLQWTNSTMQFFEPRIQRVPGESASATRVVYDLDKQRVQIEGGQGRLDPMVSAPALGKGVPEALDPYRFALPPRVRASGVYAIKDRDATDLLFDVEGEKFSWWRVYCPQISGQLRWRGNDVILKGVKASFAQGELEGDAFFKVLPAHGAEFNFQARFTNASLHAVVEELSQTTNKLSGLLQGTLNLDSGLTSDQKTWMGHGEVEMRNGHLWAIPLFGVFSPIMNAIVPGAGQATIGAGKATYRFANRLVHTEDLEVRSSTFNILYKGDVDFDANVRATAMAELLGEAGPVGRVFSLVLMPLSKLFEYRVTGTLGQPKTEPLYIPRFLTFPLTPFRTLRNLLPDPPSKTPHPSAPTPEKQNSK